MSTVTYVPGNFSDVSGTEFGVAVWAFLNEPDNLIRMETATYLSRPAVEPLSPVLLQRFTASDFNDRNKQMLGHMVRQIMEARGFAFDQSGVRITREGNVFSSGARYRYPVPTKLEAAAA